MTAQRSVFYGITLAAGLCMSLPAMAINMDMRAVEEAIRWIAVAIPFLVCLSGLGIYLYCSRRPMREKMIMLWIYILPALPLALVLLPGELSWSWLAVWIVPLVIVIGYAAFHPLAPKSESAPESAPLDTMPRKLFSD